MDNNSTSPFIANYYSLLLLFAVFLFCSLYFINPPEADKTAKIGVLKYAINPDSPNWTRTVTGFPFYFKTEYGKIRVRRPLYSFLGWSVFNVLKITKDYIPEKIKTKVERTMRQANNPGRWDKIEPSTVVAGWVSCIVVNLFLFWFSSILIYKALAHWFTLRLSLLLAIVPLSHVNSIHYYLTPNSEVFNLFIPALFLFIIAKFNDKASPPILLTILFGLSMLGKNLAYPIINYIYEFFFNTVKNIKWKRGVFLLLLILLPQIIYQFFLYSTSFPTYHHEVEQYRQVVWIVDYWQNGQIMPIFDKLLYGLYRHIFDVLSGFLGVSLVILFLLFLKQKNEVKIKSKTWNHLIIYTVTCALFWMVVGYYDLGNTIGQFPLIIVLFGYIGQTRLNKPEYLVFLAILLQILLFIFNFYPTF